MSDEPFGHCRAGRALQFRNPHDCRNIALSAGPQLLLAALKARSCASQQVSTLAFSLAHQLNQGNHGHRECSDSRSHTIRRVTRTAWLRLSPTARPWRCAAPAARPSGCSVTRPSAPPRAHPLRAPVIAAGPGVHLRLSAHRRRRGRAQRRGEGAHLTRGTSLRPAPRPPLERLALALQRPPADAAGPPAPSARRISWPRTRTAPRPSRSRASAATPTRRSTSSRRRPQSMNKRRRS